MHRKGRRLSVEVGLLVVVALTAGLIITLQVTGELARVTVSTDQPAYRPGDTVTIRIQNSTRHPVDIYCPAWCALGNFPTSVERFAGGGWGDFLGFCPSIKPLFGSGTISGDYIRHRLAAGSALEVTLSGFDSASLTGEVRMRIVYYIGILKRPVYSNEFTYRP